MNGPPAFKWSVISGFPVCEFGIDHDTRLKIEAECGLVLKFNFDDVVVGRNVQFHLSNGLALCLGEPENVLVRFLSFAGAGNFIVSHCRLLVRCFG